MLNDLFNKIESIRTFDIVAESIAIINKSSEYISDLLTQQLAIGRDGKGENVTLFGHESYTPYTIDIKERFGTGLGKVTDRITNYMSGAFYSEMYVEAEGEGVFNIKSRVPYFEKILERSGSGIMELNEEHLEMFSNNILIPQLKERFNQHLNGV